MKIVLSGYDVYESGSVFSPNLNETRFILSEEPKLELAFRIERNGESEHFIRSKLENDYTVVITFENPPRSYSHASPQKIGYLDGRELYVLFHTEIMGDYAAYNLTYTLLLKGDNNG
ncbi:TPA: hypothetical protein P0E30_005101 [Vibrio harveyi]|nr:hypothetical protein [Vibrio harveyi]